MMEEALPAAGIAPAGFWEGVAQLVADLAPVNRDLLRQRDDFQKAIDAWHHANAAQPIDAAKYRAFLEEIGYLVPDPGPFQVGTANVDPEIASLAGPQLVVPVTNGRFALNAANARWGSLYDASHRDVTAYTVDADGLIAETPIGRVTLKDKSAFVGYWGDPTAPDVVLLRHHGLHVEIIVDRAGSIGATDPAGVQDVHVEAAITTIV